MSLASPEVDDDVDEENRVGKTVEGDPSRAQVVVEERDGHGQDYQVRHEQQQHAEVPVKPGEILIFTVGHSSLGQVSRYLNYRVSIN